MPLELPCRGGVPTWAMWPDDAKKSGYGREEERTPDVVFLSSRMYNMLYMACISSTAMRCPEARYFGHHFKAGGEVPDRPFCFTCVRRVCQGHCGIARGNHTLTTFSPFLASSPHQNLGVLSLFERIN